VGLLLDLKGFEKCAALSGAAGLPQKATLGYRIPAIHRVWTGTELRVKTRQHELRKSIRQAAVLCIFRWPKH
jgi:hypothetical protein